LTHGLILRMLIQLRISQWPPPLSQLHPSLPPSLKVSTHLLLKSK
jgi:hypothetical protein